MCGIFSLLNNKDMILDIKFIKQQADKAQHRGPDNNKIETQMFKALSIFASAALAIDLRSLHHETDPTRIDGNDPTRIDGDDPTRTDNHSHHSDRSGPDTEDREKELRLFRYFFDHFDADKAWLLHPNAETMALLWGQMVLIGVVVLFFEMAWRFRLLHGGADAKAMMMAALLLPSWNGAAFPLMVEVDSTAMPPAPLTNRLGICAGRTDGSCSDSS